MLSKDESKVFSFLCNESSSSLASEMTLEKPEKIYSIRIKHLISVYNTDPVHMYNDHCKRVGRKVVNLTIGLPKHELNKDKNKIDILALNKESL